MNAGAIPIHVAFAWVCLNTGRLSLIGGKKMSASDNDLFHLTFSLVILLIFCVILALHLLLFVICWRRFLRLRLLLTPGISGATYLLMFAVFLPIAFAVGSSPPYSGSLESQVGGFTFGAILLPCGLIPDRLGLNGTAEPVPNFLAGASILFLLGRLAVWLVAMRQSKPGKLPA
jgi:hypothetical protein